MIFGIFGDFLHFLWFFCPFWWLLAFSLIFVIFGKFSAFLASSWSFLGNVKVRWWEILLEALEKSIWPSLRNTVRKEVTRIFCDGEEEDRGGIGHSSSWMSPTTSFIPFREVYSRSARTLLASVICHCYLLSWFQDWKEHNGTKQLPICLWLGRTIAYTSRTDQTFSFSTSAIPFLW